MKYENEGLSFMSYPLEVKEVIPFCKCGGVLIYTGLTLARYPAIYEHRCDECQKIYCLDDAYPKHTYHRK